MVVLMWPMVEVVLELLTLPFGSGRSGPAAIDVVADDDGRRLLVRNHGPGVARAVRITVPSDRSDGVVLADRGEVRILRPGKGDGSGSMASPCPTRRR
jgi:hypothetical protein